MEYNKQNDKELIRIYVNDFINKGHELSVQQYVRLMSWLDGLSYAAIAKEEGTTAQAVGASVKKTAEAIKSFAKKQMAIDNAKDKR